MLAVDKSRSLYYAPPLADIASPSYLLVEGNFEMEKELFTDL